MPSHQLEKCNYLFEILCSLPGHAYYSRQYFENVTLLRKTNISSIIKEIRENIEAILALKKTPLSKDFIKYFLNRNKTGTPYEGFDEEPHQVSLIKKSINALYHGEKALELFESDPNSKWITWLYILYKVNPLIEHSYDAMHQGAQSGLEAMLLIKPHLEELNSYFNDIKKIIPYELITNDWDVIKLSDLLNLKEERSVAFKSGQVMGSVVDHLRPVENYDYTLLASLSSQLIKMLISGRNNLKKICNQTLELNQDQDNENIKDLEMQLDILIKTIQKIHANSLYNISNIVNYLTLVNKLITLINKTLYKFKYLNSSEHKIIKSYLLKIKKNVFLEIISMMDRLELSFVLQPGFLSEKVLSILHEYHDLIIEYLSFVLFESDALGSQVLFLFDDYFLNDRNQKCFQNSNTMYIKKYTRDEIDIKAFKNFYSILKENETIHLAEMPIAVKETLMNHYVFIGCYIEELNPELNQRIISFLNQNRRQDDSSWKGIFQWPVINLKNQLTAPYNINTEIISIENKLEKRILQNKNTTDLTLALNQNIYINIKIQYELYKKMGRESNLKYFRCILNVLDKRSDTLNIDDFSKETDPNELFLIFTRLKNKAYSIQKALNAFNQFLHFLEAEKIEDNIFEFSPRNKEILRSLYLSFQSCLVLMVDYDNIDRQVVEALNPNFSYSILESNADLNGKKKFSKDVFKDRIRFKFLSVCNEHLKNYKTLSEKALKKGLYLLETNAKVTHILLSEIDERHSYLLKTKALSDSFEVIKKEMEDYLLLLHPQIELNLKASKNPNRKAVPYPDVYDPYHIIPEQVLVIKQFINIIYYIKHSIVYLELLNDKSYKWKYAVNVLMSTNYIYSIYSEVLTVRNDLYFQSLRKKISLLSNKLYDTIPDSIKLVRDHSFVKYRVEGNEKSYDFDKTLAPILDLFYELPLQIKSLSTDKKITVKEKVDLRERSKNIRARLIDLISKSNHLTQILIAAIEAYDISGFLKLRFNEITYESYQAIISHLETIKKTFFVDIILMVESIEINLGLKENGLTAHLDNILVEIFNGFIEQLEIKDNEKFILINDVSFYNKRLNIIHENIVLINKNIVKLDSFIEDINKFLEELSDSKALSRNLIARYEPIFPSLKDRPIESFEYCEEEYKQLKISTMRKKETLLLDKQLKTHNFEKLKKIERPAKKKYISQVNIYINELYEKIIQSFKYKSFDDNYFDFGYQKQLLIFIDSKKDAVFKNALENHSNMASRINYDINLLKKEFDTLNLSKFKKISKISKLMVNCRMIIESKTYISEKDSFIQKRKLTQLQKVSFIIDESSLLPEKRLSKMELLANEEIFISDLKQTISLTPLSWDWFVAWWEFVMSALGIQAPPEEKLIDAIHHKS